MRQISWNSKVAKSRGNNWKQKLVEGKLDAALHPSKLRLLRVKKGISQGELAKKLGLPLSTYGSIERGKLAVKNPMAQKLSSTLKASVTQIFHGSDNKLFAIK